MSSFDDYTRNYFQQKKKKKTFDEYTRDRKKEQESFATFEEYTKAKFGEKDSDKKEKKLTITNNIKETIDTKEDIAPVAEDKKLKFFKKGAFEDGKQKGDLVKTILGSAADAGIGIAKGVGGLGEGIVDLMRYGVAEGAEAIGKDDYARKVKMKANQNSVEDFFGKAEKEVDKYSVFDRTSDAVMQGLGQVGAIILTGGVAGALGASAAGATAVTSGVMGLSSAGSGMREAYLTGASDKEAATYGISKGIIDAGTEALFGGLGKAVNAIGLSRGLSSLDDIFARKLSSRLSNQVHKNIAEFGVKASAEGVEELLAGLGSAAAKKLTYMEDEELGKLIEDENLLEQFVVGTVTSGMIQSGYIPAMKRGSLHEANQQNKDFISGYTQNEQKVIDKEIENRITERETDGKKLTNKEKAAIEEQVKKDLEKGYIGIDTIESALGGETYNKYKSITDHETKLQEEYDALHKMKRGDMTGEQIDRETEVKKQLEELKNKDERTQIKEKISKTVQELAKVDRLSESYNEKSRRSQAFEADLTKYDTKQQDVIKKAAESGILNNTNRTHEFVDMIAKISADKGVSFDFINNAKLKESGFALADKIVNGYVKDGSVAINIDSNKALNTVVGHEITHVLEGTELYTELQNVIKEYAITKGEYDTRYEALKELYKDIEGANIENEVTADLVGEYLFTDSDFVSRLSVEQPNIFKKIYEEIEYLAKLVTGSKEARELEKVKRAFDKAYRESSTKTKEPSSEVTEEGIPVVDESKTQEYTRENEVIYSLSNDTAYMDNAIDKNKSLLNVDSKVMEEAKAVREKIAGRMNEIKDKGLVGLPEDIEGNTFISNSSYGGTEENTTICPRSLASEAFVDAVSEYLGRPLTVEEQIYISQDLQGRSLTPECTYCYVATDRKAYRAFLGEYVSQRDAVIDKVKNNPNADVSRSGELYKEFLNGRKDTNPMYNRFKMWVNNYKNGKAMIDASHLANINKLMGDINSEFGAELKPQIADAMKYAQSASWAKKRVNYVAYNGHILKWKQDRINKLNSHYGLRMYSFSDFHPAFVLENMQMITDASVRGLKMLGYTKDTDFVEIFAPTGMNINISTFGFETSGNVYENNIIGAEWEKAKALREQHPNVGITFVATNDTLVEWGLSQDWIDVVIPFHLVRTGKEVAKAFKYTDYTSESSDTKTSDWKKGDAKYIPPTEHNNDKATYLSALEKNHLKPRFERFVSNPNYMKLVNECRLPASESKPVQPIFNEDASMRALAKLEANGYYQPIGGSVDRMYEIASEVAENMQAELSPTQYSLGEQSAKAGDYRIYGKDITHEVPARENASVQESRLSDDITSVADRIHESTNMEEVAPAQPKSEKLPERTRKELRKALLESHGSEIENALENAKNIPMALLNNTDTIRATEMVFGREMGNLINNTIFQKAIDNEAHSVRWQNKEREDIKALGIKPGSKESAAVQKYGEGEFVSEKGEKFTYDDISLAAEFADVETQMKIKNAAKVIREKYDEYIELANAVLVNLGFEPIPKRKDYFRHFQELNDTFTRFGLPFNAKNMQEYTLPTDINGLTEFWSPQKNYFANAKPRKGLKTTYDAVKGIDGYISGISNLIYHTEDIQRGRAFEEIIRNTFGEEHGFDNFDNMSPEEQLERIKKVQENHLSNYAAWVHEWTNNIAGKKNKVDRSVEAMFGRKSFAFLDEVRKQVGSNMIGFNLSSAMTNGLASVQAMAKTNPLAVVKGTGDTIKNIFVKDNFAEKNDFLTNRMGAEKLDKRMWEKIQDAGFVFMKGMDWFTSNQIVRSKYYELRSRGMSEKNAHAEAGKFAARIMADRTKGAAPQLYNSKLLGLVTQFQLEVNNQLYSMFYDTYHESKESAKGNALKTAAGMTFTLGAMSGLTHAFGTTFESVAGYNPTFDIIDIIGTALGWDDDDEEKTTSERLKEAADKLVDALPYVNIFTGGGRIPIASGIPNVVGVMTGGTDDYGNELTMKGEAKKLLYLIPPTGGNQIKKTWQGHNMFSDEHPVSGSYTDSGNLRFPVEDTLKNRIQADIFGQYASENARQYFDNDWAPLKEKQVLQYKAMNVPIEEYRKYRKEISDIEADKDSNGKSISGSKKEKVFNYIEGLDIPYEAKILLYKFEYNSDDTYNQEIIDYLNTRADITDSEMEKILAELGFEVDVDGTVRW